jgi:hypothetical protein
MVDKDLRSTILVDNSRITIKFNEGIFPRRKYRRGVNK